MESTGIIRSVDELGRIVIPKNIRLSMDISMGDYLEFHSDGKYLILQKYNGTSRITEAIDNLEDSLRNLQNISYKNAIQDYLDSIRAFVELDSRERVK